MQPTNEQDSAPAETKQPAPGAPPLGRQALRRLVAGLVVGLAAILVGLSIWFWLYPDQPGPLRAEAVIVEIPAGSGLLAIKNILAQAGVIRDDFRFVLLAKRMGAARRLKAGEYSLAPGLSPRAVLLELAAGRTIPRAITLPEGINLYQAADIIKAGGWGSREAFLELVAEPGFVSSFGVPAANLEGYLFPDTYFFVKGTGLRTVATAMVRRMAQVLDEESAKGQVAGGTPVVPAEAGGTEAKAVESVLNRHQVLILASVIEKETALAVERPLVAKVFLNRLRQGMKLQADPTVIYGLAKFGAPLTRVDLETPTPYNTYTNRGLPIGPICNPGRTAIAAVLRPAPDDYSYFVSQNDGSHYFSKTLEEHNQAVSRYRKKKAAARDSAERIEESAVR